MFCAALRRWTSWSNTHVARKYLIEQNHKTGRDFPLQPFVIGRHTVVTIDRRLGKLLPYRVAFFPTAEYARHAAGELEPRCMARLIAADVNVAGACCVIRSGMSATTCIDLNRPLEELRGKAHLAPVISLGKLRNCLAG